LHHQLPPHHDRVAHPPHAQHDHGLAAWQTPRPTKGCSEGAASTTSKHPTLPMVASPLLAMLIHR
jgi:hypothetical protein